MFIQIQNLVGQDLQFSYQRDVWPLISKPGTTHQRYPDIHVTTGILQTLHPPGSKHQQQSATIDPTFDLCIRYPLLYGWVDQGNV